MHLLRSALAVAVAVAGCGVPDESSRSGGMERASPKADALARLETGPGLVLGHKLRFRPALERFYKQAPEHNGWTRGQAVNLLAAIEAAPTHGLRAEAYGKAAIKIALANRDVDRVELDLLLSDAFLAYATHLSFGRLDPATLERDWRARRREVDLVAALERVMAGENVRSVLKLLPPRAPEYWSLVGALERYRKMSWEPLETGLSRIKAGSEGAPVLALTTRLQAEGFLTSPSQELSEVVVGAVRAFQRQHGLEETGEIGPRTLLALQATPADRIRQIELNLERWRWLPDDLGKRHVRVNIPSFRLAAFEDGKAVLEMPVIVGKAFRRTPIFSGPITDIVVHPPWGVPRRLAVEDKLPMLKKDPTYLERNNIMVYRQGAPVDPSTIDWSKHSKKNFPFQLRQAAGSKNPLGQFKFNIVNEFDVFLHDTNERGLFERTERGLSSGCIRLKAPRELALFVLGDETKGKLEAAVASKQTKRLSAPEPRALVHLLYQTAWVDNDGSVHFRADLDDRDARLRAALKTHTPALR